MIAPKHTNKLVKEWFIKNKLEVLEWPGMSSDLNTIEEVRKQLKISIQNKHPYCILSEKINHHKFVRSSILTIRKKCTKLLTRKAIYHQLLMDVLAGGQHFCIVFINDFMHIFLILHVIVLNFCVSLPNGVYYVLLNFCWCRC